MFRNAKIFLRRGDARRTRSGRAPAFVLPPYQRLRYALNPATGWYETADVEPGPNGDCHYLRELTAEAVRHGETIQRAAVALRGRQRGGYRAFTGLRMLTPRIHYGDVLTPDGERVPLLVWQHEPGRRFDLVLLPGLRGKHYQRAAYAVRLFAALGY